MDSPSTLTEPVFDICEEQAR